MLLLQVACRHILTKQSVRFKQSDENTLLGEVTLHGLVTRQEISVGVTAIFCLQRKGE